MKAPRTLLILLVLALAAVGLAQTRGTLPGRLAFKPLANGQNSTVKDQRFMVLNDQAALERYWSQVVGQPGRAAPLGVDWMTEKVVAVHMGQRNTGGYRFFVSAMEEGPNRTIVRAVEQTPTPGTYVTQALTSPWALIRVDSRLTNFTLSVEKRQQNPGLVIHESAQPGGRCNCGCPYCCP